MDRAEPQPPLIPPRLLAPGDIYYTAWCGGGGFGDPFARDPKRVAKDVRARLVSKERCRDTYGVVLTPDGNVDAEATAALRADMRRARLAEAEPVRIGTGRRDRSFVSSGRSMAFYLSARLREESTCLPVATAARDLSDHADFHDYVPTRVRSPASLGHKTVRLDWQTYREYFCPGCGVLFDVAFEQVGKASP